jgi:hypothetical protein
MLSKFGGLKIHATTIAHIGPAMKTQYQAASRNDLRAIGITASAKAKPISRFAVPDVGVGEG